MTIGLNIYRGLTQTVGPFVPLLLQWRQLRGKEESSRLAERKGITNLRRPQGPLVWVHAASVGESVSILPLIDRLLAGDPALNILVTTGTKTAAKLMAERLPPRVLSQFSPVDRKPYVRRFLDHWHPDAALWVESELWPNLVMETAARDIPMALVNARISARSFARWRRLPGLFRGLIDCFSPILVQDAQTAGRLIKFGSKSVVVTGNLKFDAPPLEADPKAMETLTPIIGDRPVWVAASTHAGEEEIIARVHNHIKEKLWDVLTVLVLRHPERGPDVARMLKSKGLRVARRAPDDPVISSTDIYLVDTIGELGIFYRFASVAFMGGSLVPAGGHNPLEPARLDAALLHGPHVQNFLEVYRALDTAGAAEAIEDEAGLGEAVIVLLTDADLREAATGAASGVLHSLGGALDKTVDALAPILPNFAITAQTEDEPSHARA